MFGKITDYSQSGNKLQILFEYGIGVVEVLDSEIIRVFSPLSGKVHESWAVSDKPCNACSFSTIRENCCLKIKTAALVIIVGDNFKVDFYDSDLNPVCMDYCGKREPFERYGLGANAGAEGIKLENVVTEYNVEVRKMLLGDECFYGLGETTGQLNKRGYYYEMWNTDQPAPHVERMKSLYADIPFFIALRSSKAYGIFFDNTFKTYFDMGKENPDYYYFAADGGNLDYYFIYGPKPADVVERYTGLTGRTPLPPLWSLGYQQSRWSYAPEEKLLEIAGGFRKRHIPCDVLYLDIDYMDGYRVFTWDKTRFPTPQELLGRLKDMGFHVVTIVDPGIKKEEGYKIFEEGLANGYFITEENGGPYVNKVWPGLAVFPDFTREKVRNWWASKQDKLLDAGVAGIWNDMDEPATFDGQIPDKVMFGGALQMEHSEAHNIYGLQMAKASYEGIKAHTKQRPFVLTRACYAGVQKYSAVWTGDNQSMWEHLRLSIPMLINMGMSGVSFCGADIGGFQYDCTPELLARWTEAACFLPLFRNHSCTCTRNQEPWAFDSKTESICKKYIELHYRLIPYLYDLFWKGCTTGLPVMRPLLLDSYDDEQTYEINDEFMVGDEILAAPVVQQGQRTRSVYLPKGEWYDFWTNERIPGGQYVLRDTPLDICPIYVKAGSILPIWPDMEYTGEKQVNTLGLRIYPGEGSYTHYQDDGVSFDYENGGYNLYRIKMMPTAFGGLEISIDDISESFHDSYSRFAVSVEGFPAKSVLVNGSEIPFETDGKSTRFTIPAKETRIEIQSRESLN